MMMKSLFIFIMTLLPVLAHAGVVNISGINWEVQVLNGNDKTVQIGNGKVAAISTETSGALIIPASITLDGVPYKVVSLADSAFYACNNLTSIEVPSCITSSGKDAFLGCSGLQKVIASDLAAWCAISFSNRFGNPVYYAKHFYRDANTEIIDLVIPDGVKNIGANAFVKCLLNSVTIPGSVAEVGGYSFYKCTSLKTVQMAKGVGRIRANAFYGCTALTSVSLPEGITRIGGSAFYGCTALELIDLPTSLKGDGTLPGIGDNAFDQCPKLSKVRSNTTQIMGFGNDAFASIASDCKLYIPIGTKDAYNTSGWTQDVFGGGIFEVGEVTENGIKYLILDENTVQIGNGKESAISIETSGSFTIPSTVTINGSNYSVVKISDVAFSSCDKLTSIEVPSSITAFGKDAFINCSGLKKVVASDLKAWSSIAFNNKPSNPLYYANHLYSDANTEIKDLVIPDGVSNIGSFAFIKGLFTTVSIPGSVAEIGSYSFYKCLSLTTVNIAKGVDRIRSYGFYGCTALTSVTLPEGMTRVGGTAFSECTALPSIELPASLTSVGDNAFNKCSSLKEIKSNVLQPFTYGKESFASISSNATLYIPVGKMTAYYNAGWTNAIFNGGIVEVGEVVENFCLENGVTNDFIQVVKYPDDDYSFTKITDYTSQNTPYRKDLPMPVIIGAPLTKEGKSLVLETYYDGEVVRSDTFCVGQRALEIWNLVPNTEYTYRLYSLANDGKTKSEVSQGSFKTEGQVRMMKIDNVRNFRDIGGWALPNGRYIKYGKLFRCAELSTTSQIITESGINELLKVQGVGVEIDFGDYSSVSPIEDFIEFVHGNDYQLTFYAEGAKNRKTQYKNCFEKVVNSLRNGKKLIFHCSAGADRTGGFAFLLEGLLGVSESDLAKDYELTSFYLDNRNRTDKGVGYKGLVDYVKATFEGNTLNEKIEQMALDFGISKKDINDFRELMTDGVTDVNGLKMTFRIISVEDKTVQIGNGKVAAISTETSGALIIPSSITLDGVPYKVVSLADSAFYACNNLTSIEVPSCITSSGKDAFLGCSGLQKVIASDLAAWCAISFSNRFGNPVYYAKHFYRDANTEIIDLVIPDGVKNIGANAFVKCLLNSVTIPGSVAEVGGYSFYKCTSLKTVQMAKGVGRIRAYAFYGCTSLNSVTLPKGMTRIGGTSFYGCSGLASISISSSITQIGDNALNGCSYLSTIWSLNSIPPACGNNAFDSVDRENCVVWVPRGGLDAYKKANGWKDFQNLREVMTGDIILNAEIEIEDLNALVDHIMGDAPSDEDMGSFDINEDKMINASDVVKLIDIMSAFKLSTNWQMYFDEVEDNLVASSLSCTLNNERNYAIEITKCELYCNQKLVSVVNFSSHSGLVNVGGCKQSSFENLTKIGTRNGFSVWWHYSAKGNNYIYRCDLAE